MVDNRLDAGPVEILAGVSVIVYSAFVAYLGELVSKGVQQVLAVISLAVQGGKVSLGLVVSGAARIDNVSFFVGCFICLRFYDHRFLPHLSAGIRQAEEYLLPGG
ncbi:MAG: hypothetical protein PHC29_02240 [Candidatus Omnitrophica bacterium]|nr:hypothetical protein [Candidatus Omnitrophota bacterium]